MINLISCSIRNWHAELLSAWDMREDGQKFQLVCIVHDVDDLMWQEFIPQWSRRNAIRLLPISEQYDVTLSIAFVFS